MSDTSGSPETNASPANGTSDQAVQRRRIMSRGQFIKDLSFENPNAGKQFGSNKPPKIDISVSVNGRPAPENAHEIELHLTAKATVDGKLLFLVELVYGGIFVISGVPAEQLEPVVMIECPRLLFPFMRLVTAHCSRDGGYPPLMLEPIDFAQMYLQRRSQTPSEQQSPDDKS